MAAITRHGRRRLGGESGAELLELAIVLPMLLVVFAAMIDFAVLFQRYQVVTNAAREGARVGILPDYGTADVQARVNTYLTQAGLTAAAPAPGVNYDALLTREAGPMTRSCLPNCFTSKSIKAGSNSALSSSRLSSQIFTKFQMK
jgi:Flp pilus assembly protein TadG